MSDERYDRSADMRLLELQRKALGIRPRVIGSTSYSDPDPLVDVSKNEDDEYVQSGTILIAGIDARPRAALIVGAVVTVSLSITNDGDTAARGVRMTLPLPGATAFRPGTLLLDGAEASDEMANELFTGGAELADIEPGARRSLIVKLVVEPGAGDILLSPHLRASSGAVLGLRAMRLTRKGAPTPKAALERPFYESDDAEHALEPLEALKLHSTIAVLQPSEIPPAVETPLVARAMPPAVAKPAVAKPAVGKPSVIKPIVATPIITKPVVPEPIVTKPLVTKPTATEPLVTKPTAIEPLVTKPIIREAIAPETMASEANTIRQIVDETKESDVAVVLATTVAKPTTKRAIQPKAALKAPTKQKPKTKGKAPLAGRPVVGNADPALAARPTARPKIEVVRSIDDGVSFTGKGGPILAVRIDRKRMATLAGLFSGASLGMIAHYLVLNALAVRDPLPGDGNDGSIATFVASQEQLLSRALIATRLGKTPAPESVAALLPAFPPALATHTESRAIKTPPAGEAMLFRAFGPTEVSFVQRMLSNDSAAPFIREAQLFVGLCANDCVLADERDRHRVSVALTAYAALATAEISRIFLRAKLSRVPALFKATDSSFDDAARTVLAAIGESIA